MSPSLNQPLVTYDVSGPIATITINRPDKRNALSADVVVGMRGALASARQDSVVRAVVLTGAGSVFSAGADLDALRRLQHANRDENETDSRTLASLFDEIYRHTKPIVGKINGHAIAGGAGLAAVCDFSIASSSARFGFTEVRLGFVPAIVMGFVTRKIGETAARNLFLRGHLITADEAARIGLVTMSVAPALLNDTVSELLHDLAYETSGSALRTTKEMMARIPDLSYTDALRYAAEMNCNARESADCRAGISAFLAREDPPWRKASGKPGQSSRSS